MARILSNDVANRESISLPNQIEAARLATVLRTNSSALGKAIEGAFGVRISEEDLREARTIGDLCDLIRSRLNSSSSKRLASALVLYQLRVALRDVIGMVPSNVTPESSLETLFPRRNRHEKWIALGDAAQLTLPSFTHPRWFAIGTLATFLITMGAAVAFFWNRWTMDERLIALIVAPFWPFMLWWMALYFSRNLANLFPRFCRTFGDLVQRAARMNRMEPPGDSSGADANVEDLVRKALQALIAFETGRKVEEISQRTLISEIL